MFADNNIRTADYYYRPSMTSSLPSLHGLGQINPSGKTVQDFLPADWFASSVYRNILDMLNTLEVARKNLYNGALGQFISVRMWRPSSFDAENGGVIQPLGCGQYADLTGPSGIGNPATKQDYQAFWGWANQFTPAGQGTVSRYIYEKIFLGTGATPGQVRQSGHMQNVLKAAGYVSDRIGGNYGITCPLGPPRSPAETHNLRVKSGLGYTSADIVNLVRSLDWEMNRVHLPLPFNLRQWANHYNQFSLDNTGIGWSQRVFGLRDLQKWIVIIREKVRRAIDASNLAIKVAEQSLRDENAAIIKEREQERIAREEARRIQIEQERIAAEKMIEEERKRLVEKMKAEIAAAQEEAMRVAQQEIEQAKIAPVPPVVVQPEVTAKAPVSAPPPTPAPEFQPPAVITPVPTIAPEPAFIPPPTTAPGARGNAFPLIAAAIGAFFFLG